MAKQGKAQGKGGGIQYVTAENAAVLYRERGNSDAEAASGYLSDAATRMWDVVEALPSGSPLRGALEGVARRIDSAAETLDAFLLQAEVIVTGNADGDFGTSKEDAN